MGLYFFTKHFYNSHVDVNLSYEFFIKNELNGFMYFVMTKTKSNLFFLFLLHPCEDLTEVNYI
jgi:hypothetical protein